MPVHFFVPLMYLLFPVFFSIFICYSFYVNISYKRKGYYYENNSSNRCDISHGLFFQYRITGI